MALIVYFSWAHQGVQSDLSVALKPRVLKTTHFALNYASSGLRFSPSWLFVTFNFSDQPRSKTLKWQRPLSRLSPNTFLTFPSAVPLSNWGLLPEDLRWPPKSQLIQQALIACQFFRNYVKAPVRLGDKITPMFYTKRLSGNLRTPLVRSAFDCQAFDLLR